MKKLNYSIIFFLFILCSCAKKQEIKQKSTSNYSDKVKVDNSQKVFLITLDGLRWQELFGGADSLILAKKEYSHNPEELAEKYWEKTTEERRRKLMPFVWSTVAKIGQIHGNRNKGSKMNLTNGMHFSYPGYNEILTGSADDKNITSNDKNLNPNVTVLEFANKTETYKNKVKAFGSWDVFPFIINEKRSGLYVNAGFKKAKGSDLTSKEVFLNELQDQIPSPWGSVRLDAFTHGFALESIKKNHPKLVYIAYGETDDYAHDGRYDEYLNSAKRTDEFLKELWEYTQKDPFYKGNTTFIISTDHGRGTKPLDTWKHHGDKIKGCDQVWVMAFGNKVDPKGEVAVKEQLYTTQIASSLSKLLKLDFKKAKEKPFSFIKD